MILTIELPAEFEAGIRAAAVNQGVEPEELARDAVLQAFAPGLAEPKLAGQRVAGLHEGSIAFMAPDFDDPLPDEFWFPRDAAK